MVSTMRPVSPKARARILLVDDDTAVREALAYLLREDGFAVAEAGTAEDALEALSSRPFDVLLVDQALPGRDGAWFLQEARRLGRLEKTLALMITGQTSAPLLDGVRVLHKPVDVVALIEEIEGFTQPHRERPKVTLIISSHSVLAAPVVKRFEALLGRFDRTRFDVAIHDLAQEPLAERVLQTPAVIIELSGHRQTFVGDLRRTDDLERMLAFLQSPPLDLAGVSA